MARGDARSLDDGTLLAFAQQCMDEVDRRALGPELERKRAAHVDGEPYDVFRHPPPAPPFELPEGARWVGDNIPMWHHAWIFKQDVGWWRYYRQTTVYAGPHHTAVVHCDSEQAADAVLRLRLRHPDVSLRVRS